MVISHLHLDHLDLPSLRRLGTDTALVVPRGAGALHARMGFTSVEELAHRASLVIDGVEVRATKAEHSGFRLPFGPTAEALGFVFELGNESVYFAGDTDIFPEMADLAGVDLALLPVWGWGPRLGPGHMDPERAADALRIIKPRAAVPIHWGTLWPLGMGKVMPQRLEKPPLEFAEAARAQGARRHDADHASGRDRAYPALTPLDAARAPSNPGSPPARRRAGSCSGRS